MRIVIIGDSIASGMGLGRRGERFGQVAAAALGAEALLDLARPSRTTREVAEMLDKIAAFRPTVAFICCGGTEALVYPGAGIQRLIERFAPQDWHGVAGLHPRVHYSKSRRRRARQRLSSWSKVTLKHALVGLTRAGARIPAEEFGASLLTLLEALDDLQCRSYVLTMCHIDDKLFPRSEATLTRANVEIERVVNLTKLSMLVRVREVMHYWDDFLADRAHWSISGHHRVAAILVAAVRADATVAGSAETEPSMTAEAGADVSAAQNGSWLKDDGKVQRAGRRLSRAH